jgi:Protein of unknown function (DUF1822)
MTYIINEKEDFSITLPIAENGRTIARQFASEQPNPEKAERVLLNTLAVWIANNYLQMLGITTNISNSDSWNPVARLCADVADLEVTGIGKLECRPLKASQTLCSIPAETWGDRIGYIVVEIDDSLRQARLLGFTPTVATEELPVTQLQPLENLIDRLHELRQPATARVNLSQWFDRVFETGWEVVETLFATDRLNPGFSFRGGDISDTDEPKSTVIQRGKALDLGMQLGGENIVLIVELEAETAEKTNICLQVHCGDRSNYLPPGLKLSILDDSGATFMEAQARSADNYVQLQFSGKPGEHFSVSIALDDASVVEDFVI